MYSRGQKFQNYLELQIFLLSHRCLGVSYPLPIIARLCHEWIMLPMKFLTALCSVSTAGFLRFLKHPVQVSVLQLRRLIKGHLPNHRALPLLVCCTLSLFAVSSHFNLCSICLTFLQLSKIPQTFSTQSFLALFLFFKFAFYHHTNQSFPFLFCSLQFS